MHVHVVSPDGEAKFWIKPVIALADYSAFTERQLRELERIVERFQKATISQIYDMRCQRGKHLHWPSLDIDLDVESLKYPDAYPLIYK